MKQSLEDQAVAHQDPHSEGSQTREGGGGDKQTLLIRQCNRMGHVLDDLIQKASPYGKGRQTQEAHHPRCLLWFCHQSRSLPGLRRTTRHVVHPLSSVSYWIWYQGCRLSAIPYSSSWTGRLCTFSAVSCALSRISLVSLCRAMQGEDNTQYRPSPCDCKE